MFTFSGVVDVGCSVAAECRNVSCFVKRHGSLCDLGWASVTNWFGRLRPRIKPVKSHSPYGFSRVQIRTRRRTASHSQKWLQSPSSQRRSSRQRVILRHSRRPRVISSWRHLQTAQKLHAWRLRRLTRLRRLIRSIRRPWERVCLTCSRHIRILPSCALTSH